MSLENRFNYPAYYNNRELSWLAFNERVLQEAMDKRNPLLERIKFLAIFSSNLDEFFMVRVAGLKDQVKVGYTKPENKAGMTPKQQLAKISEKAHVLVNLQDEIFRKNVLPALKQEDIHILKISELTNEQKDNLEHFFYEQIFPVLTPMAIDAYRPFPLLLNKSINLAVSLVNELEGAQEPQLALVQVPSVLKRFVEIPYMDDKSCFILLEDIITHFIDKLFNGYKVVSVTQFRITRNADLTIHEEGARDLLQQIEKELKKRKWGAAVRLEIKADKLDKQILGYLLEELEVKENDVYYISGPIDKTFLFSFYKVMAEQREDLAYEPFIPKPYFGVHNDEDIFQHVLKRDLLFNHPYESFQPVIDLVSEAAR